MSNESAVNPRRQYRFPRFTPWTTGASYRCTFPEIPDIQERPTCTSYTWTSLSTNEVPQAFQARLILRWDLAGGWEPFFVELIIRLTAVWFIVLSSRYVV